MARLFQLACSTIFASCLGAATANANAIYNYSGNIGSPGSGLFSFDFEVTDAVVAAGHTDFRVTGGASPNCFLTPPTSCLITGDPTGFVSAGASGSGSFDYFAFPSVLGTYIVDIKFASDGMATRTVTGLGAFLEYNVSFGSDGLGGTFQAETAPCNGSANRTCQITPIPEGPTLPVLIAGLSMLAFVRRPATVLRVHSPL